MGRWGNTLEKQKKASLFDLLNTKKTAWQEDSKHCHGRFNGCTQKHLQNCPTYTNVKIRESLEINNLETKAEYNQSIKVLNRD